MEDSKTYPTIYYTSKDGYRISEEYIRLENNIISHTIESNGECKIVCKNTLTSIPDNFFRFSSGYGTVTNIRFENCENITSIGYNFLYLNVYLESIDFNSLSGVTSIGHDFMCGIIASNFSPINLDFTPLYNVKEIKTSGNYTFFLNASTHINILTFPNNIFTDAACYIGSSSSITDFRCNLKELVLLGDNVHESLGKLINYTTHDYINPDLKIYVPHELVEAYKERFPELADRIHCVLKEECSEHFEWPEVDYPAIMYTTTDNQPLSLGISGETSQEKIGRCFVHRFPSETITIPNQFLYTKLTLERIKFNKVKHSSTITPTYFGAGWQNCKEIDLSAFSDCTGISTGFLSMCYCLENLNLRPLSNCTTIGSTFMGSIFCEKYIDFTPLSNISYTQLLAKNIFVLNWLPNIDLRNVWGKDIPNGYILASNTMFTNCYFLLNLHIDFNFIKSLASNIRNNLSKDNTKWVTKDQYIYETGYSGEIHDPYIYIYGKTDENNKPHLMSAQFGDNPFDGMRIYVEHSEYPKWLDRDINYGKWLYCMNFPDGIINYESTKAFNDIIVDISYNSIFKEKCDYKVIVVVNGELMSLIYHYEEGDTPGHVIAGEQGVGVSIFAPVDSNKSTYFSFGFDSYRDITSLYIRCVEPLKYAINWRDISWHWYSLNNSDAIYGVQYICNSPGTNGMAKIRCNFSGLKSITFAFRSDAESNYDYLIVGKLDIDLGNVITTWTASSVYNNANVVTSTRGKQGQWLTYTFNTDANEHFVDFIFGKDNSTDTQPDNAQVYVSAIAQ